MFFRDSCARQARQAGVAGWIRNNPDGRVEATFEGEPDAVVTSLEVKDEAPQGDATFRAH